MKYKTVEGHEIVRDGEYETRAGGKLVVIAFIPAASPIVTYDPSDDFVYMSDILTTYSADGFMYRADEPVDGIRESDYDLMRPWKEETVDWCDCSNYFEIPSDEPFKKYQCHDCRARFYEKKDA